MRNPFPSFTGFFVTVLAAASLTGCDQQQTQLLRTELQSKDKAIEELNKHLAELERQNGELEVQVGKAADPEKLADAIAKRVEEKNAATFAELKKEIDQVAQARPAGSAPGPSVAEAGPGPGVPPSSGSQPPARTPSSGSKMLNPSGNGENRSHVKLSW